MIRWYRPAGNQAGFTLLELLVSIAILGFIMSGVSLAVMQIMTVNASSTNRVAAIREVQNAGYWVSLDGQQAQEVLFDDPATEDIDELLYLSWIDWDSGDRLTVVYNLNEDQLVRTVYKNGALDSQTAVAHFISAVECNLTDPLNPANKAISLTITATVGGFRQASETRVYEIIPRASLG
jgi:prepilin-type N-terminal cleavage/methylation domain-containing protein